jgi:hypothetical protein
MNDKRIVWAVLTAFLTVGLMAMAAFSNQDQGAEDMTLYGGTRGDVPFPHRIHQVNLVDCQICHVLFPQVAGSIEDLKTNGQLTKKQVMNKQCTKCHREKKKQGLKTGPTTCKQCHIR